MRTLAPEHELLLACATSRRDNARGARVRESVRPQLRWEYLLELAERHWVMPLLAWHLLPDSGGGVPPGVLTALRRALRANAGWSLRHAAALVQIMDALEAAGVQAAAWKGPALALAAYGHLGLRAFADLDVLVGANDLERAARAVGRAGFRPEARSPNSTEWPLVRDDGIFLELHSAPMPRVGNGWEFTTLRRQGVRIDGRMVPQLAPCDLLVTLCVHGGKHRWERLLWIADVAELIGACPDLDWSRVDELATRHGARRMVGLGLRLARDLLGAAAPAGRVGRTANGTLVSRLASVVTRRLFEEPRAVHGLDRASYHAFQVATRERARDKLRYLLFPFAWRARFLARRLGVHAR